MWPSPWTPQPAQRWVAGSPASWPLADVSVGLGQIWGVWHHCRAPWSSFRCPGCHLSLATPHPLPCHAWLPPPGSRLSAPARVWRGTCGKAASARGEGRAGLTQLYFQEEILPTHFPLVRMGDRELGYWENKTSESPRNQNVEMWQSPECRNHPNPLHCLLITRTRCKQDYRLPSVLHAIVLSCMAHRHPPPTRLQPSFGVCMGAGHCRAGGCEGHPH